MHRVGIIPFATQDVAVAILFVTSQTRGRWILPKGKIEGAETHAEACHREGFEEAGIRGVLLENFPLTVCITKQTKTDLTKIPVTYYPFFVTEQVEDWPERRLRQRHWALIEDAPKVAYRDDFHGLFRHFEDMRPWIIEAANRHKSPLQGPQTQAP